MIYFLSDLHAVMDFAALKKYLHSASENDLLIILGDIGLEFENTLQNNKFNSEFLSANKKIAFLDGNHENFNYLNSFPQEKWNGGIVGRLTENIVHLKRGNIYNIDGKSFFVFGGCKSSPKWKEMGLWYPEEEPSDRELSLAYENLKRCNYKVDYVLTHRYDKFTKDDKLQELIDFIDDNVSFDKWFSGHWHENNIIDEKHLVVYDKLTSLI